MGKQFYDEGCVCFECVGAHSLELPPLVPISNRPTPWAVRCPEHGQVYLTSHEYRRQLARADVRWWCPICGLVCDWDDDNYEEWLEQQEERARNN